MAVIDEQEISTDHLYLYSNERVCDGYSMVNSPGFYRSKLTYESSDFNIY